MRWLSISAAAVAAAIVGLAAGASQAAVVTVECEYGSQGVHALYDIDYDASTVRSYAVNDDGGPATFSEGVFPDRTFPAHITDREITWTDPSWVAGYDNLTLGRLSGTLRDDSVQTKSLKSGKNYSHTTVRKCEPYTPPSGKPRF